MDAGTLVKLILPASGLYFLVRRFVIHIRRPPPATPREAAIIRYERLEFAGIGLMFLFIVPFLGPWPPLWLVVALWVGAAAGLMLAFVASLLRQLKEGPYKSFFDRY